MYKPCSRKFYWVLPLLLSLFYVACNKEKKTTAYDFSYSGSSYAGNTIHFTTTPATASKFAWDFGDKNTAAAANPDHVYSVGGTYVVSLVVNDDTAHTIKKTLKIGFDSLLMSSIAGSRLYHHTLTEHREINGGGDSVTVIAYPDVTMTITNIDPVTFLFGSDTLFFSSSDTGTVTLYYTYSYYYQLGSRTGDYNSLTFDIAANKIYYYTRMKEGVMNYNLEEYDTP